MVDSFESEDGITRRITCRPVDNHTLRLFSPLDLDILRWTPKLFQESFVRSLTFYCLDLYSDVFAFIQIGYNSIFFTKMSVTVFLFDKKRNIDFLIVEDQNITDEQVFSHESFSYSTKGFAYRICKKENKIKIALDNKRINIDLNVYIEDNPFRLTDGKICFSEHDSAEIGSIEMGFLPLMNVNGTVYIKEANIELNIKGISWLNSINQRMKPNVSTKMWVYAHFVSVGTDIDIRLSMLEFQSSEKFNSESVNHGILCIDKKLKALSIKNRINLSDLYVDDKSEHRIPGNIEYYWEGITLDDEKWTAAIRPNVNDRDYYRKNMIKQKNLLYFLPFLLRAAIKRLFSKPYLFQWIGDLTKLDLTIGDKRYEVDGNFYAEITLL